MSLLQSNLRKQIRKLPKILNFVKIIQYYSILFNRVLRPDRHAEKVPEALAGVAALVQQQEVREGAVAGGRGVGKVPQPIELGRVQYVVDDCHLRRVAL